MPKLQTAKSSGNMVRFSLRTLIIATAVIAIGLAVVTNRARNQRIAVAQVLRRGGWVGYDGATNYRRDASGLVATFSTNKAPPGLPPSNFLRSWLGNDYFDDVYLVQLRPTHTRETLSVIARLPNLEWLSLKDAPVGDADVDLLAELHQIKVINLEGTSVSDEGVERLKSKLPECEIVR